MVHSYLSSSPIFYRPEWDIDSNNGAANNIVMDDGRDEDGGWMAFYKKKKKLWSLSLFSLNSVWSMADDDDDMPLLLLTAFEVVLCCCCSRRHRTRVLSFADYSFVFNDDEDINMIVVLAKKPNDHDICT